MPVDRGTVTGRTVLEAKTVHVSDVLADHEYTLGDVQRMAGYRAALGVPFLREGNVVGVIFLARSVTQGVIAVRAVGRASSLLLIVPTKCYKYSRRCTLQRGRTMAPLPALPSPQFAK